MNITEIRNQFPILDQQIHGHPLVYLDNAATTQKPQRVIDTLSDYYRSLNANIHRGAHHLAAAATERYESVRRQVQQLINSRHSHEIIFTRGTTESINLVAHSFSRRYFTGSDEIIVSGLEHHSNIVPWQLAGASLRAIPLSDQGVLDIDAYRQLFSPHTRLVAVAHVSNTLGTINPVQQIIDIAHSHGVPVLIDGAQAVSHLPVDVQTLGCDFYCFSGHKMYAPMGVGVLYGREELLDQLPPYQGGGEMISEVSFEKTTYNQLPFKFEAGTPSVGDVLGLGEAIAFIQEIGLHTIAAHEDNLLNYATQRLLQIPGLRLFGNAQNKTSVISFLLHAHNQPDNHYIHPYDVGTLLDQLGIAVRTGHHCTQPLMDRYQIPGTVRASFALYNTRHEIDALVAGLEKVMPMLE